MNSEKMKGEIFTDKNEALNVTRLELNKLKKRVEEIDVNSLVKELTRQKDAASDLRRQLNELRKRVEDVKVNSTIAENELRKQLANRSTQVRVSDTLFYYMTGSVGAGIKNQIPRCDCLPKRARYLHLSRQLGITRSPTNNATNKTTI